jgi:DNA-nicking Smr family endonuclease
LTETDEKEWARFAGRIAPLRGRRAVVPLEVPRMETLVDAPGESQPPVRQQAARSVPVPLGIGGQPAGVDTATWQRFHRDRLGGVRKLDLHGMTAHHAFAALRAFLRTAQSDQVRCVEIVTGRGNGDGGGVLRRELPHWLNLPEIRPMVLAAAHPRTSSAMHSHVTNSGSVRLLLRRPRA